MKKTTLLLFVALMISWAGAFAQKSYTSGGHGHTLNLGIGVGGYYGYYNHVGHSLPVININYEFDVAKNFTLAPFVSIYSYRNDKDYYRETILPIGVKGTYYLDDAFRAGPAWDFYVAGSLGFAVRHVKWDDGHNGETYYKDVSPLILDLHLGAEYHISSSVGLFLDLSTGVTTLGLSFR
jgi:hypothetical protein